MNAAEAVRRNSATQAVLELLQANPLRWVSWREIATVGGVCAWRTRISDARRIAKRDGERTSTSPFSPSERVAISHRVAGNR